MTPDSSQPSVIARLRALVAEMRYVGSHQSNKWADELEAAALLEGEGATCTCGSSRPESARYGHSHLAWCPALVGEADTPPLTDVQRANLVAARDFIAAQGGRSWRHHAVAAIDAALALGEARAAVLSREEGSTL